MKLNEGKDYVNVEELDRDIKRIEKIWLYLWFFGILIMFVATYVTIAFSIRIAAFLWFLFALYMVLMFKLGEKRNRLIGQKEDLEECQPDIFKDRFN